ncbi:MAG: transketolase [Clostridia bacterium]|nr:transketolase [Clostridia bacterium]
MNNAEISHLQKVARRVRQNIVKMLHKAGAGHPGGSLSVVEILVALYFEVMRIDPCSPNWEERDRFILSKGHAAPALYAVLAARGYFPEEELLTFDAIDSRLQGHPCMKTTPGVDMSSGSLGQGLSVGLGMALGAKLKQKDFRVWVLLGDGELQEGQVWEAAMAAVKYRTTNLTAIVDMNGLQLMGKVSEIMPIASARAKWEAFGWAVTEIDGHDFREIISAMRDATDTARPVVILANTIKGKGVSFMENQVYWHSAAISDKQLQLAMGELAP